MKIGKKSYIFTNKEHPQKGIMSTILGIISVVSIVLAIYFTFKNQGVANINYGMVCLLTFLFSIGGLILGIMSRLEPNHFYFFSYLGIVLNAVVFLGVVFILLSGVYGFLFFL